MVLCFAFLVVVNVDEAPKTLKLVLLLILTLAYAIGYYRRGNQLTFDRIHYWIIVLSLFLLWVIYSATLLREPLIAFSFLAILLGVSVLLGIWSHWLNLHKTTSLRGLLISYVSLSAIGIVLFVLAYAWFGLEWSDPTVSDKTVTGYWILYFSGSVYYSNAVGDIVPIGTARWFVLVESACSVMFHVIIVARAINKLGYQRDQHKQQENGGP